MLEGLLLQFVGVAIGALLAGVGAVSAWRILRSEKPRKLVIPILAVATGVILSTLSSVWLHNQSETTATEWIEESCLVPLIPNLTLSPTTLLLITSILLFIAGIGLALAWLTAQKGRRKIWWIVGLMLFSTASIWWSAFFVQEIPPNAQQKASKAREGICYIVLG